ELDAFNTADKQTSDKLTHYKNPSICVKRRINRRLQIDDCLRWKPLTGDAGSGLDFNRDRVIDKTRIRRRADLDASNGKFSRFSQVLDDWGRLTYHGGGIIGSENQLVRRDVSDIEPTTCKHAPDDAAEPDDEITDNTEPEPDTDAPTATSPSTP